MEKSHSPLARTSTGGPVAGVLPCVADSGAGNSGRKASFLASHALNWADLRLINYGR